MKLYNKLPTQIKSRISKINYLLNNKPYILDDEIEQSKKFPKQHKAGVIISADFELGWAVRYSKQDKNPDIYAQEERKNVPLILDILEKFDIGISWSTVGHLFLDHCSKGDHDWMSRIPHFDDHWKFIEGDWFDCDPYGKWNNNLTWYAPDLVDKIIKCKTPQEIACHTFSHIDCSYKNCPSNVLDDEIKACYQASASLKLKFKSLTFPGGTAGNYEILKKYGIEICRKRVSRYEIGYPFRNSYGILITPTGPIIALGYKDWSLEYMFKRYKKAIDKTINSGSLIHLWFHPSQEEQTFTSLLPMILEYLKKKQGEGSLWIGTMSQLADHINQNRVL